MDNMRGYVEWVEFNGLSVRLELQADCFAGVWANRADAARQIIEPGEIEQALNAASAISDDRLQQQTQGRVVPESFYARHVRSTHALVQAYRLGIYANTAVPGNKALARAFMTRRIARQVAAVLLLIAGPRANRRTLPREARAPAAWR